MYLILVWFCGLRTLSHRSFPNSLVFSQTAGKGAKASSLNLLDQLMTRFYSDDIGSKFFQGVRRG